MCCVLIWTFQIGILVAAGKHRHEGHKDKSEQPMSEVNDWILSQSVTAAPEVRASFSKSVAYDLHDHLLKGYKPSTRPILHPNDGVNVSLVLALYQIIGLDQVKNTITMHGSFELYWQDVYLQWQPDQFAGTTEIFLSSKEIWIPELSLYYSHVENQKVVLRSNNDVRVNHTGHVRYYLPFTTESLCTVDVRMFPFDRQSCDLWFGSWQHSQDSMQLMLHDKNVFLGDFFDNQEWTLLNRTLHDEKKKLTYLELQSWPYDNHNGGKLYWSIVLLHVSMQRQSFYYVFNLVIPSTIITVTAIIGFHMPSNSGRMRDAKFRLGIITLMSMSVILLAVVKDMPKFSLMGNNSKTGSFSGLPLIGLFYFSLLTITGVATVTTSLFVLLERSIRQQGTVPWWLRWIAWSKNDQVVKNKAAGYRKSTVIGGPHQQDGQLETCRSELKRKLSINDYDNLVVYQYFHVMLEELTDSIAKIEKSLDNIRYPSPKLRYAAAAAAGIQHGCVGNGHELVSLLPQDDFDTRWWVIIQRLEYLSLFFYLSLVGISVMGFFWNGWYLPDRIDATQAA